MSGRNFGLRRYGRIGTFSALLLVSVGIALGSDGTEPPSKGASPDSANGGDAGGASGVGDRAATGARGKSRSTAKDAKWDVADPGFACDTLDFVAEEGTWISVDVHPDGRTLAFDLLGDIYTLPVEGGEATCVASGLPYEVQPRWSPDGSRLLFTSDRGGGDNLWSMAADGSDRRQLTRENHRLLNNGVWHPSGRFVVGRKHFTSRRSMGAGEMWLYPFPEGGAGVRLTERRNDQQDANEPEISPDGRYMYWSEDMSPGGRFEYNKDPHEGIYVLRRLDTETGEVTDLLRRPGGAVRPQASPDGRHLACVRRAREKTVLSVLDLATGEVRDLWDGLSRDQQETWALFGAHPGYDWMPDGRALVVSAQGKLWKIDAEGGGATSIPFRARVRQAHARTVRFELPAGEPNVEVKVVRWPQVTANGRTAVFQALGCLYKAEIRDGRIAGAPQRLTRQAEELEFAPALSNDDRTVVYVTWNDREGGRIRAVDLQSGRVRTLVDAPGHYGGARISRDGRWLVYHRLGGGWMRGYLWTESPGIYLVDLEGRDPTASTRPAAAGATPRDPANATSRASASGRDRSGWADASAPGSAIIATGRLVSTDGRKPRFDATGRRIYLLSGEEPTELVSLDLHGADRRVHARSEEAWDIVPSPDGRYLAFEEQWQTYVMPFPLRGRTLRIGPSDRSVPVKRLSADAGTYLSWSPDSRTVRWSLGPELSSASIEEVFAWTPDAEAEPGADGSGSDAEPGAGGNRSNGARDEAGGAPADSSAPDGAAESTDGVRAEIVDLGFTIAADMPATDLWLVGARIVPMDDASVIEDGVVHVLGNRIEAVAPGSELAPPDGAQVIDLAGKTILPGFIDVHAHFGTGDDGLYPQQNWALLANLAFGVTTVHDPSHNTEMMYATSERVAAGALPGPRIWSTGTILYGAEGGFRTVIHTYEDALRAVRRTIAWGPRSVKSYNQPRRDQRQMVIQACRELGVLDIPEGGSTLHHNMTMLLDGHTTLEHPVPVGRLYEPELRLFAASGTGYTPTLIVGYGGIWGENYWYQHTPVWENERLLRFVPRAVVDPAAIRRTMAPENEYHHFELAQVAAEIYRRGGIVETGAHGQLQGLGFHWELWMLGQGGLTPHEALRCATFNGARALGLDHALGSVRPGKLADLIVVEGDLLEDLRNSEKIAYTMVNGRLYDARTLEQLAPDRRPLPPGPILEPSPPWRGGGCLSE